MPRKATSQWDFGGDLFPAGETRRVLSVSEVTQQVKRLLEKQVGQIWVTGEVTNLRVQSSGHSYFTIKDAGAQLSCVLFRGEGAEQRALLQDGRHVLLHGDMTVYEQRGQYQLIVRQVELQGVGALQLAFEKLKQKLNAEGLFAPERKRPLPRHAQRIGLVTSPTGAAIRDVLHVIERRNPALEIVLVPCRVQGDGAAAEIAAAVTMLSDWHAGAVAGGGAGLDLILVTRGGGSLEDLWAFNEEAVARAIFHSAVPVVSAVGHEIDFTISDFVADLRAATPSAAAEIITEGVFGSRAFVSAARNRMQTLARRRLELEQEALVARFQRLARAHPRRRLNERWQRLDDAQSGLARGARQLLRAHLARWHTLAGRLARLRPSQELTRKQERLARVERQGREAALRALERKRTALAELLTRLRLLSPEQVLARGYSITRDAATGKIIRNAAEARAGQRLKTRVKSGEIESVVRGEEPLDPLFEWARPKENKTGG
ncbi:MAG TPA: exodeoxyribonuclease VII large subunit [Verrucomicrobiae bacterium]|nr:exodeoxyribonuclease VII large subunit [Verrucomicrobiae bacterium]